MRRIRRAVIGMLATGGLIAGAGCSSSGTASQPTYSPPAAIHGSASAAITAPANQSTVTDPTPTQVADTPSQPTVSGSFTATSSQGIKVTVRLTFDAPVVDGSAAASANWTAFGASGSIPCATGSNQNAVIVGTLEFTNQTPSYTPDVYIDFSDMTTGGNMSFGANSNDGECVTDGSDGWEGSTIQPTWTGAQWGPAAVAIVIQNYYGPDYPDGDSNLLGKTSLVVYSPSDHYTVDSTTGIISQLSGPVMLVNLSRLAG